MPRVFLCNCARFNLSNIARRISQIICAATPTSWASATCGTSKSSSKRRRARRWTTGARRRRASAGPDEIALNEGNTAQFGGASGSVFSAICGMQIPRFTSSKPSEFAFASDEKSIRRTTASFVRCCPRFTSSKPSKSAFASDEKPICRPTASFVRCYHKNDGGPL